MSIHKAGTGCHEWPGSPAPTQSGRYKKPARVGKDFRREKILVLIPEVTGSHWSLPRRMTWSHLSFLENTNSRGEDRDLPAGHCMDEGLHQARVGVREPIRT